MISKTGNPLGIAARMISIPPWSSLFVKPAIQLTQTRKRPLTGTSTKIDVKYMTPICNIEPELSEMLALTCHRNIHFEFSLQESKKSDLYNKSIGS